MDIRTRINTVTNGDCQPPLNFWADVIDLQKSLFFVLGVCGKNSVLTAQTGKSLNIEDKPYCLRFHELQAAILSISFSGNIPVNA